MLDTETSFLEVGLFFCVELVEESHQRGVVSAEVELFAQSRAGGVDAVDALVGDVGDFLCGHVQVHQGAESSFVGSEVGIGFDQVFKEGQVVYIHCFFYLVPVVVGNLVVQLSDDLEEFLFHFC